MHQCISCWKILNFIFFVILYLCVYLSIIRKINIQLQKIKNTQLIPKTQYYFFLCNAWLSSFKPYSIFSYLDFFTTVSNLITNLSPFKSTRHNTSKIIFWRTPLMLIFSMLKTLKWLPRGIKLCFLCLSLYDQILPTLQAMTKSFLFPKSFLVPKSKWSLLLLNSISSLHTPLIWLSQLFILYSSYFNLFQHQIINLLNLAFTILFILVSLALHNKAPQTSICSELSVKSVIFVHCIFGILYR